MESLEIEFGHGVNQVCYLMAKRKWENIFQMQRDFIDKRDRKIQILKSKDEMIQKAVKKFADEVNELVEATEAAYHVQGSDKIRLAYDEAKKMTVKVADLLKYIETVNSQEESIMKQYEQEDET